MIHFSQGTVHNYTYGNNISDDINFAIDVSLIFVGWMHKAPLCRDHF
jgi:hypothetical protein